MQKFVQDFAARTVPGIPQLHFWIVTSDRDVGPLPL